MKIPAFVRQNPLFYAFLFPACVDALVTLAGQDKGYWQRTALARDASPAYYFLLFSPWLFLVGSILWFVFWYWAFLKMSRFWKYFFTIFFIAAHSWGSSTWIIKMLKADLGFQAGNQANSLMIWLSLIFYYILVAFIATRTMLFEQKLKK